MNAKSLALPLAALAAAPVAPAAEPFVCNVQALTEAQRERHRALGERMLGAVVSTAELPDGYQLGLDLSRIGDPGGHPWSVVEIAEWVSLESRCCPFLDFRIDVSGKASAVRLRLSGPKDVKEFLRSEIPILGKEAPPPR